ncbi:hypothetical protein KPL71_012259 [Citrus sinensis]|uniref:Uncharacterized protein n=1 Tax=Citrus sinensis TaxID=2711 RepID=A0ACB8L9X5_CITSI|nr:hypothetical protein KPL71_012259 [Citrus sinensis]
MSSKVDLEKFTGQNDFNMWKIKMEALLITQGLGEAIDPVSKLEGGEASSSKTLEQVAEIDKKARSTIILSLGDSVIREVAKERIVAGLWAKLENLYMTKSLANRLYIKMKMFSLKMIEGASLNEHIDEFNKVCDELETINEGLSDESKALLLISSLPKSYEHFVDALLYGRQTFSLEEVKSALGTKKLKDKQDNPESESSEGLIERGRPEKRESKGKKQGISKFKQRNLKCFHCHKEGNFKIDCPERKNKNKETKKRTENAAIATEEECSFETAGVLIATSQKPQGQWVLDLGCTFHMCPNRSYFTTYQSCDGGMVLMGSNSMCKVVGIETISLRMFDGVVRELTQVKFVPELKRNLISIGMLDQTCCVIKAEKSVLRVIKGSMVIMKGLKQNGLYVTDGHTAVREASVTDSGGNRSMLWHLRMGHMSERGLRELQKQEVFGNDHIAALGFCEDCILGKSSKLKFETAAHTTKEKLGYIHSDLWGHTQVNSLDNGLEYCNKLFEEFCEKNGIQRHKTVTYTPQQNGLAERMNKTLVEKGKLEPRALKCRFLGYPEGVKGYRLWCVDSKPPQCIISRNVRFHEEELLNKPMSPVNNTESGTETDKVKFQVEPQNLKELEPETEGAKTEPEYGVDHESAESEEDTYQLARDRKRMTIKPPKRYAVAGLIAYALTAAQELNNGEPMTYQEVITGKNKLEWKRAMDEERTSLMKNKTWELIEKLAKRKTVSCKWIFKIKDVRHASIRIILALVAVQDMHIEQMDVKTAFLHGELQEEIVMQQPEGCSYDCCVYFKETSGGEMIYLLLYVDDMLIACHDKEEINHLKKLLRREFEIKELGEAKRILGMDIIINRSKKSLFLTQQSYIQKVLVRFGMNDGKQVQTPLASHFKLSTAQCPQTEAEQQKMACIPYSSVEVASLAEALKEAIWLKGMITELGAKQESVAVYNDSQSAIHLSKNQSHHEKTKHIDVKLHFMRLEVSRGAVKLLKIHTEENPADMLSKVVPTAKFILCMNLAGDVNKPAESSKLKMEFLGAKDKEMDTSNVETGPFDETKEDMSIKEPSSYFKAIKSENYDKWIEAMREEMDSLQRNQICKFVPNLSDKKLINCKWIFKKKHGMLGVEPSKFKVRLVARGFIQRNCVYLNEIFSLIVKHNSIKILLAMTALHDMELEQMDVKTAFLDRKIEE